MERILVKEVITKTLIYSDGYTETNVEEVCYDDEMYKQLEKEIKHDSNNTYSEVDCEICKVDNEREEIVKIYRETRSMCIVADKLGITLKELEDKMIQFGITLKDKYTLTSDEIIDLYVNHKMSVREISNTYNMPKQRVRDTLCINNIEINDQNLSSRITDEHDEELVKLYNEGMKKSDIARTIGMSYSKTCRRLRMLGCGIKDISNATNKELYVINTFKECKTIANTYRKTGIAKVEIENILLKYGIPFGYRAKDN